MEVRHRVSERVDILYTGGGWATLFEYIVQQKRFILIGTCMLKCYILKCYEILLTAFFGL